MNSNNKAAGHLALAAAYTIFGVNIILTKDISNSGAMSPISLFTVRAIGAATLFWLISLFVPHEKVPLKDLGLIALASFTGFFVPQYTFLKAITMATTIDASIMGTLGPVFTMLFAALFVKEPITGKKALGVAISFAGVLLLIFNSTHHPNGVESTTPMGFALLTLNSIAFSLYLGAFRPLISRYSVVTFLKWIFLFGLILSLPMSAGDLLATDFSGISRQVWLEIGFLVFFATFVAYFLIPLGQKALRPTIVALYTYVQPICATIISIAIGADVMTWQKALAVVLVFGGVFIVTRSRAAGQSK